MVLTVLKNFDAEASMMVEKAWEKSHEFLDVFETPLKTLVYMISLPFYYFPHP